MNLHGNTQASDSSRGAERDAHAELRGAPRRISGAGYARMGFPAVMGCAERRVAVGAGEKLVATHAIEVGVHRLTPELSRPARCDSARPRPRSGLGLNELLGREGEALRCPIPESNWAESRNVYAADARDIETILAWIATSLVMGVDAADTAEEVFGLHGVPLVQRELVFSAHNPQLIYGNTGHYRAPTAAQRAVAAT